MKTLCFLFLAFIYLLPGCSSADNTPPSRAPATDHGYTAARETADALEEQYDITILIGPDCNNATTDSFTIGNKPSQRSPFMELLGGYNYESELSRITDVLSVYPTEFFSAFQCADFPNGLRFLLADQILYEDESMAGVTIPADEYCNIFLGVGSFNSLNIHHEIWHATEYRATIFEALFRYDQEWWDDHPYIRRKLERMMEVAEPIFGTVYDEGKP